MTPAEPAQTDGSAIRSRVAEYFARLYRPGEGRFHSVIQAAENPVTGCIAFAGSMYDACGFPVTRIGLLDGAGAVTLLRADASSDTEPKWSPDGSRLAFLSDRGRPSGNFRLCVAPASDVTAYEVAVDLPGEAIESFAWSADGRRVLVQSADAGADAAGSAATARIGTAIADRPSWGPTVETGGHENLWRRARIWNSDTGALTAVGRPDENVWEADWCGPQEVVAIVSASPTEGGWYQTSLAVAPATGGAFKQVAAPDLQLAGARSSPDGRWIAVVQGRFHRTVGLGTLTLYDRHTGRAQQPNVRAEVSSMAWRDSSRLFYAGFRAPETVAGTFNVATGETIEHWRSSGTAGRKVPHAIPIGSDSVLVPGHAFDRAPYLARIQGGAERVVFDCAHNGTRDVIRAIGAAHVLSWRGRDGLDIQGYLALPAGVPRPPLVAFIHGGPSHLFRDSWTFDNPLAALLVSSGYAVLCPNPRGSSGRGLDFASRVIGDWGGEDRHDVLAGIDHVLANFEVDGKRLFVIGGSYGGFMTTWLVTHTNRFAAACAIAPLTDLRSFYFTAHHPEFIDAYVLGNPYDVGGVFDDRSPLRRADRVKTPTMLIAGNMDKTTPASQAVQFHRALVLNGVPSELVVYPEEGHAVARLEAQHDQAVRVLHWFKRWETRVADGMR